MPKTWATMDDIRRQLESLNLQEQDAVAILTTLPNTSPRYEQTVGLLVRIRTDKAKLEQTLTEVRKTGRTEIPWGEIAI